MASLRGASSPMATAQEWVLSSLGTTWPSQEHGGGDRVWAAEGLGQVTSEGSTGALTTPGPRASAGTLGTQPCAEGSVSTPSGTPSELLGPGLLPPPLSPVSVHILLAVFGWQRLGWLLRVFYP